jgi:Domain of unknown function (DUF5666)
VLKRIVVNRAVMPMLLCCSSVAFVVGCKGGESKQGADTSASTAQGASTSAPPTVRGTVASVNGNTLVLKSDTGNVTITMVQPFHLYTRVASDLSHVKDGVFIGVTTVKQPDGSERATEIHIFPEELRGLGEGSRMMAPGSGGSSNRMTNGNVSNSRMTNGTASQSRMSNGSVSGATGSSLVVQFAGGSTNVTVPPNTKVSELKVASRDIAVGDQVAVLVKKAPDGTLSADKALSTAR